jgi:hypothetical protein
VKLFRKKEVWVPTWQGSLMILLLIAGLFYGAVFHLYPFLALTRPVQNADMVIVEGWMADEELQEVAKTIRPGQIVITTGGPVTFGQKILQYDNYAGFASARLVELGIPAESIVTVPAPDTARDRTYVSAQAARQKLEELRLFGKSVNLYTTGAHARRSYELFRVVFGKDYPLGVVSIAPAKYHLDRWFSYSAGVKHVLMELISWAYAQVFLLTHHA